MDLFLLRHAEAGTAARDEERTLTAHGHAQAQAVASGLATLGLGVSAVVSSPLPRARETAAPVAAALSLPLRLEAALATGRAAGDLLALLEGGLYGGGPLVVGHEPQLSALVEALTGGRIHLRKAMLVQMELTESHPPRAALAALLSWRHLAALSKR